MTMTNYHMWKWSYRSHHSQMFDLVSQDCGSLIQSVWAPVLRPSVPWHVSPSELQSTWVQCSGDTQTTAWERSTPLHQVAPPIQSWSAMSLPQGLRAVMVGPVWHRGHLAYSSPPWLSHQRPTSNNRPVSTN